MARLDVLHGHQLPRFLGQPLGVGFEDVLLGLGDDLGITRILAESRDECRRLSRPLAFSSSLAPSGTNRDAGTSAP